MSMAMAMVMVMVMAFRKGHGELSIGVEDCYLTISGLLIVRP